MARPFRHGIFLAPFHATDENPTFKKEGTVTAGNASGLNDAGAAVVLRAARKYAAVTPSRWPGSSLTAMLAWIRQWWVWDRFRHHKRP
jgi:hypothetical protein